MNRHSDSAHPQSFEILLQLGIVMHQRGAREDPRILIDHHILARASATPVRCKAAAKLWSRRPDVGNTNDRSHCARHPLQHSRERFGITVLTACMSSVIFKKMIVPLATQLVSCHHAVSTATIRCAHPQPPVRSKEMQVVVCLTC